ncbi:hypothetical protein AFK68_25755 [Hydrocoleum sp. CS-953]|nr:hypothetical protein AFK68_25755 [Hydrocoleum sp. CS-953]
MVAGIIDEIGIEQKINQLLGEQLPANITGGQAVKGMLLNGFSANFCSAVDGASPEQKAKYPLREGQVSVRETPGRPGVYACTVHLQPHAQLDQVISSFKLVTELSSVGPAK